jgi:predicted NAD-dependent protein-ADP-ribosyltransferase YbiA (DUF1768 family)
MRVILRDAVLVVIADDEDERARVGAFLAAHADHVFHLVADHERALALHDLGPRDDACREPINIASRVANPAHALISNFAATPFVLDGRTYASVEGFWQSLRFTDRFDRTRVAALSGGAAKRAGDAMPWGTTIVYEGETIAVGRSDHWLLMQRACEAKFGQHAAAREALLATGGRPLTHRMRRDSRSIPGVIMADIWMRVRSLLHGTEHGTA